MITLSKPELLFNAGRFVSNEATRFYLNGVFVEPARRQPSDECPCGELAGAYLVATDGHRMFIGYDEGALWPAEGAAPVIINLPKIKAERYKRKDGVFAEWADGRLTVSAANPHGPVTLDVVLAPEIDGTFPDWRRCLPSGEASASTFGAFNADYIKSFGDARRALTGERAALFSWQGWREGVPTRVRVADDAFGIIMPLRSWDYEAAAPSWLTLPAVSPMKIAAE